MLSPYSLTCSQYFFIGDEHSVHLLVKRAAGRDLDVHGERPEQSSDWRRGHGDPDVQATRYSWPRVRRPPPSGAQGPLFLPQLPGHIYLGHIRSLRILFQGNFFLVPELGIILSL